MNIRHMRYQAGSRDEKMVVVRLFEDGTFINLSNSIEEISPEIRGET